ncbi:type II secretion system protein N [Chitinimonas sp. BJYL2]|uniref:type II secretion system protein N n=1 Tax=Chitinimonas sp. BJYL2 TaxID=2976696 RepID=UPI0022B32E01|nr:type II secretion system protein N [Chitinimonas sp. BJYL2]
MRRLSWRWWLGLAFLLVGFALVRLPAGMLAMVVSSQTEGQLTLVNAAGSLWHGSAQPVIKGQALADRLSWSWQPKALLRGQLVYLVRLGTGQGMLTLGWRRLALQDAHLGIAASPVFQLDQRLAGFGLGGQLWLNTTAFEWQAGQPNGSLQIEWRDAASSLTPNLQALGSYQLALVPAGKAWQLSLGTTAGRLLLNGQGSWQPAEGLTAEVGLRAAPGAEAALAPFLSQVGQGEPGTERRLRFNFR